MKAALPPIAATPAMLLAADPPLVSRGTAHRRVEPRRPRLGVEQLHRPLGQVVLDQERVVAGGDDVDDGVADGDNVEGGLGHGRSALAAARPGGQRKPLAREAEAVTPSRP